MDFARQHNFCQPFSQVYFADENSIRRSFDSNERNKISRHTIFDFENYETRFEEILNQGYSWININFAGMLENSLLIIIEIPNHNYNVLQKPNSVNISLPDKKIQENDWKATPFYEIIE